MGRSRQVHATKSNDDPQVVSIPEVSDVDIAFPARGDEFTPPWDEIPDEFKKGQTPEVNLFSDLFYGQPSSVTLEPREGVDREKAIRVLRVVMGTYGTKHEHKEAGWAYLVRQWFTLGTETPEDG